MRRIALRVIRIGFGLGLLAYLVESGMVSAAALRNLALAWPISVAAIALVFADLALMSWRLSILFRPQGLLLSGGDALRLTFVGSFFSNFLPGRAGGDLAKIFYASKENPGRRAEIVTVLLFDRALGLFSLLLLPLLMIPFFPMLLRLEAVRISIAIIGFLALGMISGFLICLFAPAPLGRWMAKRSGSLPGRGLALRLLTAVSAYGRHRWELAEALGLALAANLVLIFTLMLAVLVVNPSGLEARLCVLAPIGQLVNSIPLTPGGLGVGESAFQALFDAAGVGGGANVLICWRIWNFLVGLLGLMFYLRGFRTRIPERQREPADVRSSSPLPE